MNFDSLPVAELDWHRKSGTPGASRLDSLQGHSMNLVIKGQ